MNTVACIALILACLSFGLYGAQVVFQLLKPASPANAVMAQLGARAAAAQAASIPDITDLIKALGGLVDSLIKAGPTLTSLIASIFFMAIAVGAHAIPDQQCKAQTTQTCK